MTRQALKGVYPVYNGYLLSLSSNLDTSFHFPDNSEFVDNEYIIFNNVLLVVVSKMIGLINNYSKKKN